MIRIKFDEPDTSIWRRWIRDCNSAAVRLQESWRWGQPFEIEDVYRRSSIKASVYLNKTGPFNGKCAYCESYITDFQHGDMEHFRPKKGVTDENGVPVMVTAPDGTRLAHPGYYWLAYNWRNLLPSCATCNQPGQNGIGKHNRFPVTSPPGHAITEAQVAGEKPLLLNPIDPNDDDPEEHLDVDLKSGALIYKNGSKRAELTVKIFGLNLRDQLVQERKDAIESVQAKAVKIVTGDPQDSVKAIEELEKAKKGELNHSRARRAQLRELKQRFAWL